MLVNRFQLRWRKLKKDLKTKKEIRSLFYSDFKILIAQVNNQIADKYLAHGEPIEYLLLHLPDKTLCNIKKDNIVTHKETIRVANTPGYTPFIVSNIQETIEPKVMKFIEKVNRRYNMELSYVYGKPYQGIYVILTGKQVNNKQEIGHKLFVRKDVLGIIQKSKRFSDREVYFDGKVIKIREEYIKNEILKFANNIASFYKNVNMYISSDFLGLDYYLDFRRGFSRGRNISSLSKLIHSFMFDGKLNNEEVEMLIQNINDCLKKEGYEGAEITIDNTEDFDEKIRNKAIENKKTTISGGYIYYYKN